MTRSGKTPAFTWSPAAQLFDTVAGKKIKRVIAARSPHKFAWFHGDPGLYDGLLADRTITGAAGFGGMVEIEADGALDDLFHAVKSTLAEMAARGGRDTEKDLFGQPGGYILAATQPAHRRGLRTGLDGSLV